MNLRTMLFSNLQRIFLGLIALSLFAATESSWAIAGTIQNVIGSARISQRTGQERSAIKGDNLYEGDTVATGVNANVQIRMIDEAMIWLRPQSRFVIDKYSSDIQAISKKQVALRLLAGSMRSITGSIGKSNHADYKLSTPNATIGIRGTEFETVYATPQIATDMNVLPGTYNRVYSGSTFLEGPSGRVILNKDEAGFMGLDPIGSPRVLPSIPNFLNTSTSTSNSSNSSTSVEPKQLLISVRFSDDYAGNNVSTGSRDNNSENRVRAVEGVRAILALRQANESRQPGRAGARVESSTTFAVVAKVSGTVASVQFLSQQQSVIGSSGQAAQSDTSLTVPLGVWTEVSGRGPWSGVGSNTISSRDASGGNSKVYIKVEEISR